MGRVARENAAGGHAQFDGIVGTLSAKGFELEVARTGLGSTEARACGFRHDSLHVARRVLEGATH